MTTVDNRVVHMTFDNAQFERNIAQTMASMEKMKASLDFSQAKSSFADLNRASSGFSLGNIASSVENISSKFTALGATAFAVIASITSRAVNAGITMAKSFTVGPIVDGFHEMETNMNSIQTILANTESKGSTLEDVNSALDQLNTYSDQTIYNFSQMAKNIGTFTAAGVDLDTSVGAIKGIANLAAISGSNADQASSAMYQLSQALASGSVKLMDWNSIVNAGMGGEVFQKALFETGKSLGTIADVPIGQTFDQWKDAGNSFRGSLEDGWLTAEVLTNTLQGFTGDLDAAQLKALGYTDEQVTEMMRLGKLGKAAATEVKTLTQLLGTVKESVGSGWSKTFQTVFGDFNEAKTLFTGLSQTIGGFVSKQSDARNELLKGWKDLGGRDQLILALKQAFEGLGTILKPIHEAFRDIFPKMTAQRLFELTNQFRLFTAKIAITGQTAGKIREIFRGVFSGVQIGIEIIKQIAKSFKELFDSLTAGSSGGVLDFFVDLSGKIQDLKKTLVDEGGIAAFFDKLVGFFKDPLPAIQNFISQLKSGFGQIWEILAFGGFSGGALDEDSWIVDKLFDFRELVVDTITGFVDDFKGAIDQIMNVLLFRDFIGSSEGPWNEDSPIMSGLFKFRDLITGIFGDFKVPEGIANFFKSFGDNVDENTTNSLAGGFDRLGDRLNTLGDILGKVWDILGKVWDVFKKIGDVIQWAWGIFEKFANFAFDAFQAIFDFAKNIGPNLQKAFMSDEFDKFLEVLQTIAALMGGKGLFDLGSKGLKVDADLTGGALPKLGDMFQQLGGTFYGVRKNLEGLTGVFSAMQTEIKANALMKIAIAIGILTASVLVLSMIDPDALGKALSALAIGFGQLVGAMALMTKITGTGPQGAASLTALATGMILLSTAVLILSTAVAVLAQLSWEDLSKGMAGVTAILLVMIGTAKLMEGSTASLIAAGVGMVGIGIALNLIAASMLIFSSMSWEELGKGMAAVAVALLIIAGAINLMPASTILIGPGLAAVGLALNLIAAAVLIFATMSWKDMAKGMAGLAASLLIIAGGLALMGPSVILIGPGLIAVAIALNLLGGALLIFATMSWEEIGKSMTVLAGSLLILAGAMALMSGGLPGAIAVGVMAVSLMLLVKVLKEFAGMKLKDIAKGLLGMAIAIGGIALLAVALQPAVVSILALGIALSALGLAFVLFGIGAALLAEAFQIIAAAGTAGIDVLMYAIDQLLQRLPEMAREFAMSLIDFAQMILDAAPALIVALGKVLAALLDQIILLVPKIRDAAIAYIGAFLEVIRKSTPDIVKTGIQLLTDLLHGIEKNIGDITTTVAKIITNFLNALAGQMPEIVAAGLGLIAAFIQGIADNIQLVIDAGIDLVVQFLVGLVDGIDQIAEAVGEVIDAVIQAIADLYTDIAQAGTDAFIEFMEGMGNDAQEIIRHAARLVGDLIDAIVESAIILANRMLDALIALLDGLATAIDTHNQLLADSAHHLIMSIVNAMITMIGLKEVTDALWNLGKSMAGKILDGFKGFLHINSPSRVFMEASKEIPEGVVRGLSDDKTAEAAGADLAGRTASAFQKSLAQIPDALANMNEFAPTITPVLDLTNVKSTAGQLSGLLNDQTLTAQASIDQANLISANTLGTNQDTTADAAKDVQPKEVKFEQNIYSPKPITPAVVYRQTRNQLELAKKELSIP